MIRRPRILTRRIAASILLCGGWMTAHGVPEASAGTAPDGEAAAFGSQSGEAVAPSPNHPLAGTDWRLVEIQSMDDAVGTKRPDDPSLFTMRLGADGTVHMRLDCNRANGSWSAEPGADGSSGRFELGPLATTRALCPPPNLDEEIARQAEYIRSYLLKDGRLYLSLMADGGIWAWEPVTEVAFEATPEAEIEAAILAASPDYTREMVDIDGRRARYVYSRVDLDGDGTGEVLVYLLGSIFCGSGGCDLLLLAGGEEGYSLVNSFPISRLPVIVSDERTAGWRHLFKLESGGGVPASWVEHVFDGEAYVERQRLPASAEPEGVKALAGDVSYDTGTPLEPRS